MGLIKPELLFTTLHQIFPHYTSVHTKNSTTLTLMKNNLRTRCRDIHTGLYQKEVRVEMQNCIKDKFLSETRHISKHRELRRISLAKESLMEGLDRYTAPLWFASSWLSLPCVADGRREDFNTSAISASRRHTFWIPFKIFTQKPSVTRSGSHWVVYTRPNSWPGRRYSKEPSWRTNKSFGTTRKRSSNNRPGLSKGREAFQTRVASPVTASLIQSGQNRFTKDRPGL